MRLTIQEKESFEANGYLLKKGLVSQQEIGQIRQELKDVHRRMVTDPPPEVPSHGRTRTRPMRARSSAS